jgi:peptide chain release factor 1
MIDRDHLARVLGRLPVIEAELSSPATAANQKRYRELVQEHVSLSRLREHTRRFEQVESELAGHREILESQAADPELKEMARAELDSLALGLASAEQDVFLALLPPDPNDRRAAIMEIRAGTGGDEASLFAGDLFRMYGRYAAAQRWKTTVIDASASSVGGYKDLVFSITGENVYGVLRYEGGVHRVQRVPVTESSGRIHTSTATVAVFPEVEETDEIEIKPEEVRLDLFCASGPGGQSVNTTYSAVRVTHLPTGIVAQSQDERSQQRNREKAMSVLKARLLDQRRLDEEAKMGNTRRSMIGTGDRSERIRTYNFPQNRLTDHRINFTLYSLDRVMEGELGSLVSALKHRDIEIRLARETGKPVASVASSAADD